MRNRPSPSLVKQKARRATIVALSVNSLLGLFKILIGILVSSVALIADGFDSIMDLFMGFFAYIGAVIAQKPADDDHHWGHEKVEILFLLLIIVVISVTGFGILLQAIDRMVKGIQLEFTVLGLIIAAISIFGKIGISIYVRNIAIQIDSASLKATALNYMTDVISSLLVLVAIVGALFNIGILDSILAIIICLLILYGAYGMLKGAINILLDKAPEEKEINQILELAYSINGVKEVHRPRLRKIGREISGDIHVLVDPAISVQKGHEIIEEVITLLQLELGANINVRMEPYNDQNRLIN